MYHGALEVCKARQQKQSGQKVPVCDVIYFETREKLIDALPGILKGNDTILVKASHGMGFDEVVKALLR
jgi:UDP-N-acetylmuramoyl-tripeptide--D-alanyl-D-alanine ligase